MDVLACLEEEEDDLPPTVPKPKRRQGFAALDAERRKAIASMGGIAAHAAGRAHRFTTEEARAAGRKGGLARKKVAT